MKQKLEKILPKSEFARNVLTLMTGTSIAQAIPIVISPFLARLYTPEDFGVLALYGSVLGVLLTFSNGGYESAIVQPKKKADVINILGVGLKISLFFVPVIFFIVLFFGRKIVGLLKNDQFEDVIYFVPVSLFLMSIYNLFNYFNIKEKQYKNLSSSSVYRSLTLGAFQLFFGFFHLGYLGLVFSQMVSQLVNNIVLFKPIRKKLRLWSRKRQMILAKEYENFPKYMMWSASFNSASSQLPTILLAGFFGNTLVGFFGFSQRIIYTPMSLIGGAVGQVFYQKSAEIKEDRLKLRDLTYEMYKNLFCVGIVPFLILTFYSDYIFRFVFGQEWEVAGKYTQVLAPWVFFVFLTSPLSTVFITLNRQKEALFFNILIFVSRVGAICLGYYYLNNGDSTILLYGGVGVVFWSVWCFYMLKIVGVRYRESVFFSLKYIFVGVLFGGGIRFLIDNI